MTEQGQTSQKAWNPLTFRGLARFASSKWPRLLLIEFVFSLVVFASVIWFVGKNYAPVIVQTIHQLPETGRLEKEQLQGIESRLETDGRFLTLVVDTNNVTDTGTGYLQVAFGQTNVFICSDISSSWGCLVLDYPGETIDLSRSTVQPWWGARQPLIIMAVGAFFIVAIFVTLPLIALCLLWLPKFLGYFADRQLNFQEAWKLAIAGQFPGLIVLAAAIVLFGTQAMDLLGLGVFYVLHIVVDIVYLVAAVPFLPRIEGVITSNPFTISKK